MIVFLVWELIVFWNMVPCDNEEGEIQEGKVICKEGISFFCIAVNTGSQHVVKYNNFVRYFVLSSLLPGVPTSKNKSYCVSELCPERLNIRSLLEPFVFAL